MHLAEKAGLWNDDRRTAAREVERRIQAGELTVVRLSFADQHGILRGKTLTAGEIGAAMNERRRLHHHHAAQGHRASHGVPGVGRGRRVRLERMGGRGGCDDAARPVDLPRAAVGAAYRLDAVRHRLRRRPADAAQHAPDLSPGAVVARRGGLRVLRRPRGRVPSLQAGEDEPRSRRCRASPANPARRPRSRCSTRATST